MIENRAEAALAFPEASLCRLALGDVAQMRGVGHMTADGDLGNRRLDREFLAILAQADDLAALAHQL